MEWKNKHFSELTVDELHAIYHLRTAVFVVEQKCPYQEIDEFDPVSYHMWMQDEEGIQAYLRVMPAGVHFAEASIGRIISMKRRSGLGTRLLQEGIKFAREKFQAKAIRIEAQTYAQPFYEQVGFRQVSDVYLWDGIPHIQMLWEEQP